MLMKLITKLKNQKGFTLIELLVVISIIGVLAAVAVPKYMDSTASARTAKVQADLMAIDSAIQLYSASNSGNTPGSIDKIEPFLNGGKSPTSVKGMYKIAGKSVDVTADPVYGISVETPAGTGTNAAPAVAGGVATVTLGGTSYTAATLSATN